MKSWYSMRSWIECLFKDSKRGGLAWHHTKITDPKRAERHWLAIAIALQGTALKRNRHFVARSVLAVVLMPIFPSAV